MPPKLNIKPNKENEQKGKYAKSPQKPAATEEKVENAAPTPPTMELTAFGVDDGSSLRRDDKNIRVKREPSSQKKISTVEVESPLGTVIEDIDLEEANSETSDDDDVYYKRKRQKSLFVDAGTVFGATTDLVVNLDADEDADELADEVAEEEEHETMNETGLKYLKQEELKEEVENFFNKITELPDIEQLSLDLSVEKTKTKRKTKDRPMGDAGTFVDPLTGEIINLDESTDEDERLEEERLKSVETAEADRRLAAEAKLRQEEEKFTAPESASEVSINIPLYSEAEEDKVLGATEEDIDIERLLRQENDLSVMKSNL